MRKKDTDGRSTALLEAMDEARAPRFQRVEPPRPRREMVEDFTEDEDTAAFLRAAGKNRRLRRSLIPKSKWGRMTALGGCVVVVGAVAALLWSAVRYVNHDPRFRIASSQSIEMDGNSHITRSQMLSIFGEDVDRNIFHVPLAQRRAELEQLPWVQHATVMRLLPNRIRVHIVERTPVAFVRQGGDIGLVDANGVLLDIPPDAPGNPNYSFPVVTGIKPDEPASTRAARMKIYTRFVADLDSAGEKISSKVSEVDLSDPEDIRALIPVQSAEVLVHFGQENFLERYRRFEEHVAEWRSQYPRLSGVDMRYDRQAVLQMPPGSEGSSQNSPAPANAAANAKSPVSAAAAPTEAKAKPAPVKPAPAKMVPNAAAKPVSSTPVANAQAKPVVAPKDRDAETARKVAAIQEWMAKREKMRQQQKAAHPPVIPPASGSSDAAYHSSQVK